MSEQGLWTCNKWNPWASQNRAWRMMMKCKQLWVVITHVNSQWPWFNHHLIRINPYNEPFLQTISVKHHLTIHEPSMTQPWHIHEPSMTHPAILTSMHRQLLSRRVGKEPNGHFRHGLRVSRDYGIVSKVCFMAICWSRKCQKWLW